MSKNEFNKYKGSSEEGYGDDYRVKGTRIQGETEIIRVHKSGVEEKKGGRGSVKLYKYTKDSKRLGDEYGKRSCRKLKSIPNCEGKL